MSVSRIGWAPGSSRVLPSCTPQCQGHTGQDPLKMFFLHAPSCHSYSPVTQAHVKVWRWLWEGSLVGAHVSLMKLGELISWEVYDLFGWEGRSNPPTGPGAASSKSCGLCHPLCNQIQFATNLSLSSDASILVAFFPDIHSRESLAKEKA